MRFKNIILAAAIAAVSLGACKKESKLTIEFPERFEGKSVEMLNFKDSTVMATAVVRDGSAEFILPDSGLLPALTQLMVDGRVNAYYVAEAGKAVVSDSTSLAVGTPLNDRFTLLMARLDSIEELDDMDKYTAFSEEQYNANRDNVLGDFFGVELLKYIEPSRLDSLLASMSDDLRTSRRVRYYENFARQRAATAPGNKFVDIPGETARGAATRLSSLMTPGKYTLVDFWASWCPYCIREIPAMKELESELGNRLAIVGVAVRDLPEDTRKMVEKYGITWKVLYNTQKVPYDIYGFSGIPHHMLIAPDGTIVSRGENLNQIAERVREDNTPANK